MRLKTIKVLLVNIDMGNMRVGITNGLGIVVMVELKFNIHNAIRMISRPTSSSSMIF